MLRVLFLDLATLFCFIAGVSPSLVTANSKISDYNHEDQRSLRTRTYALYPLPTLTVGFTTTVYDQELYETQLPQLHEDEGIREFIGQNDYILSTISNRRLGKMTAEFLLESFQIQLARASAEESHADIPEMMRSLMTLDITVFPRRDDRKSTLLAVSKTVNEELEEQQQQQYRLPSQRPVIMAYQADLCITAVFPEPADLSTKPSNDKIFGTYYNWTEIAFQNDRKIFSDSLREDIISEHEITQQIHSLEITVHDNDSSQLLCHAASSFSDNQNTPESSINLTILTMIVILLTAILTLYLAFCKTYRCGRSISFVENYTKSLNKHDHDSCKDDSGGDSEAAHSGKDTVNLPSTIGNYYDSGIVNQEFCAAILNELSSERSKVNRADEAQVFQEVDELEIQLRGDGIR